ncbi:lysozyme inhibitor LprI family protein [Burkholderia seminalis]|uniref:lysozyme inhibitor LprI family protein n=1 Tax=Burkholderia seminalis TaxID=488731 RepID=UPI001588D574|nr:lysozyme inhibitor LprI family protein [Burkholderia seminalis]
MEIVEIQKSVNTLLQNDWVKILALPSLGGIYLFFKYLLERKIEGKPDAENISQLNELADLKEKLDKNGMTLEELQSFRAQALGKSASIAIVTAQQYTDAASQLVGDAEKAEHDPDWEQALTQTDMNLLSMKKATQADDELAAIINSKIRELDGDDRLLLQQSQSAWESFRETETTRESRRWEGGTIRPLMVNLRYEAITRERIAGLST